MDDMFIFNIKEIMNDYGVDIPSSSSSFVDDLLTLYDGVYESVYDRGFDNGYSAGFESGYAEAAF